MQRFRCRGQRRSGSIEIRLVTAPSIEAARERLIMAGLEPIEIEPIGASLFDRLRERVGNDLRLPDWPMPTIAAPARPTLIAIGLLLSVPLSVAIGSWSLAASASVQFEKLAQKQHGAGTGRPVLSEEARIDLARALSRRTIGDVAVRLAAALPQDASVHALASEGEGRLTVEIDMADPDRLRAALATEPLFARLAEIAQQRTDSGSIRVTLQGDVR